MTTCANLFDVPLHTEHLILQPASLELALADLQDPLRFAELLQAEIPDSWPPELYDSDAKQWTLRGVKKDPAGLITWYILLKRKAEKPLLIGNAGFKGIPTGDVAEIGYSIVPEWQRHGLGTETVHALAHYSFHDLKLQNLCAHTLPELIASQRVLEKNGFVLRGVPAETDTIRYEIHCSEWAEVLK
jgi:[ribosomal protein S5]-alanine N-acetyltransferase